MRRISVQAVNTPKKDDDQYLQQIPEGIGGLVDITTKILKRELDDKEGNSKDEIDKKLKLSEERSENRFKILEANQQQTNANQQQTNATVVTIMEDLKESKKNQESIMTFLKELKEKKDK